MGERSDLVACVAPHDLEHQQDRADNQKQGTKGGECRRRQAHTGGGEDAAKDEQEKTAELFREKDRAFASMCDHSEPLFRFDRSIRPPGSRMCSPLTLVALKTR